MQYSLKNFLAVHSFMLLLVNGHFIFGQNVYVQVHMLKQGSSDTITCSENETDDLSDVKYSWTYEGRSADIDGGSFSNNEKDLIFENIGTKSCGDYQCWEHGKDRAGEQITRRFYHKLIVFKPPDLAAVLSNRFTVPSCDQQIEQVMTSKYVNLLCNTIGSKPCPYKVMADCDTKSSTVTLDIEMHYGLKMYQPSCNAPCMKAQLQAQLANLERNVEPLWSKLMTDDVNLNVRYTNRPHTKQMSTKENCPVGYQLYEQVFCSACSPGYFWDSNTKQCEPCPKNYYMSHGGAIGTCTKCRGNLFTSKTGSKSVTDCKSPLFIKAFQKTEASHEHVDPNNRKEEVGKKALKIFIAFLIVSVVVVGCIIAPIVIVQKIKYNKKKRDEEAAEKTNLLKGNTNSTASVQNENSAASRNSSKNNNCTSQRDVNIYVKSTKVDDMFLTTKKTINDFMISGFEVKEADILDD